MVAAAPIPLEESILPSESEVQIDCGLLKFVIRRNPNLVQHSELFQAHKSFYISLAHKKVAKPKGHCERHKEIRLITISAGLLTEQLV